MKKVVTRVTKVRHTRKVRHFQWGSYIL